MREWLLSLAEYVLSAWETLLIGGLTVASLVISILELVKIKLTKKISNGTAKGVLLSWLSVIMSVPTTAVYNAVSGICADEFWIAVVVNAFSTILLYWFYEALGLRALVNKIARTFWEKVKGSMKDKILENDTVSQENLIPKYDDTFKGV